MIWCNVAQSIATMVMVTIKTWVPCSNQETLTSNWGSIVVTPSTPRRTWANTVAISDWTPHGLPLNSFPKDKRSSGTCGPLYLVHLLSAANIIRYQWILHRSVSSQLWISWRLCTNYAIPLSETLWWFFPDSRMKSSAAYKATIKALPSFPFAPLLPTTLALCSVHTRFCKPSTGALFSLTSECPFVLFPWIGISLRFSRHAVLTCPFAPRSLSPFPGRLDHVIKIKHVPESEGMWLSMPPHSALSPPSTEL